MQLMGYHYAAVELRYEGKTYKEIVVEIAKVFSKAIRESKVRDWFAKGGILHEEYAKFALDENERRRADLRQRIKALASDIPKIMEETLFQPLRNPFTGQVIRDEAGNPVYVRNKTTNDAVRIIAELSGFNLKEADEDAQLEDRLEMYFKRLEAAPALPQG